MIRTPTGEEKVIANDIFRERVTLRNGEGEHRTIPLADLLKEVEAAGGTITPAIAGRGAARPAAPTRDHEHRDHHDEPDAEAEESHDEHSDEETVTETAEAPQMGDVPGEGAPVAQAQGDDKRPHRRRGRRGGRRNRGRRENGDGSPPPPPNGSTPA